MSSLLGYCRSDSAPLNSPEATAREILLPMGLVAQELGIASPAGNVGGRRSCVGVDPKLTLHCCSRLRSSPVRCSAVCEAAGSLGFGEATDEC